MNFRALRLLAWISIAATAALGATRPRYGGSLRIQTSDLPEVEVSHLVAERLVRLDPAGYARGWLALAWQHDPEFKKWRFTLRPDVLFHDGAPMTAAAVAPLLSAGLELNCTAAGQALVIRSDRPAPDLLATLAAPQAAIVRREPGKPPVGTGPFRVDALEAGRSVTLVAFEDYWAGRPYLDRVEFSLLPPRPTYQPSLADVWRLPVNISGRTLPESIRVWRSAPRDLIALAMDGAPAAVREAVSLSIDRDSIVNVLTQRRGEAAYSLVPGWLSGYAFLFRTAPDLARARQLSAAAQNGPLEISGPPGDPLARLVAERIIVNARDAGLILRLAPHAKAPLRVQRIHIAASEPRRALASVLSTLGFRIEATLTTLESAYQVERAALQDGSVAPVVFVPEVYAIAPRVHNWDEAQRARDGMLHLEDVWVDP
jgi:hypothetical protein